MQITEVAEATVTMVAAMPPMVTAVVQLRLVPLMVISVPPAMGPPPCPPPPALSTTAQW